MIKIIINTQYVFSLFLQKNAAGWHLKLCWGYFTIINRESKWWPINRNIHEGFLLKNLLYHECVGFRFESCWNIQFCALTNQMKWSGQAVDALLQYSTTNTEVAGSIPVKYLEFSKKNFRFAFFYTKTKQSYSGYYFFFQSFWQAPKLKMSSGFGCHTTILVKKTFFNALRGLQPVTSEVVFWGF